MDYKMQKNYIKIFIILLWGIYSVNAWSAKAVQISDKKITEAVLAAFQEDDLLDDEDIKVSTRKGVVKLTGMLIIEDQITAAKEAAMNIEGVKSLDTQDLKLPSTPKAKDKLITAKVKSLLILNGVASGVKIKTINGVVYLNGLLTEKRNRKVQGIVSQVNGISDVVNNISIKK